MKAIVCEMCGSNDVVKQDGFYVCQAISPTLVRWFGNTEWFRKFWEKNLNKMVAQLQEMGYESSPYND